MWSNKESKRLGLSRSVWPLWRESASDSKTQAITSYLMNRYWRRKEKRRGRRDGGEIISIVSSYLPSSKTVQCVLKRKSFPFSLPVPLRFMMWQHWIGYSMTKDWGAPKNSVKPKNCFSVVILSFIVIVRAAAHCWIWEFHRWDPFCLNHFVFIDKMTGLQGGIYL